MAAIKFAFLIISVLTYSKGRTLTNRNTPDMAIDMRTNSIDSNDQEDCTSPMCWFRPGKRVAKAGRRPPSCNSDWCLVKRISEVAEIEKKREKLNLRPPSCKSGWCSGKRWLNGAEIEKKKGKFHRKPLHCQSGWCMVKQISEVAETRKRYLIKKAALKRFLEELKEKNAKKQRQRQVLEDGCTSPMCWFRPGRGIKDAEEPQGMKNDKYWEKINKKGTKMEMNKRNANGIENNLPSRREKRIDLDDKEDELKLSRFEEERDM